MSEDIGEAAQQLKAAVKTSGVNLIVPYTYCKPLTIPANATNGTNSQPLTKGMGLALKRMEHMPFRRKGTDGY